MKKNKLFLGAITLAMVIGLIFAGCSADGALGDAPNASGADSGSAIQLPTSSLKEADLQGLDDLDGDKAAGKYSSSEFKGINNNFIDLIPGVRVYQFGNGNGAKFALVVSADLSDYKYLNLLIDWNSGGVWSYEIKESGKFTINRYTGNNGNPKFGLEYELVCCKIPANITLATCEAPATCKCGATFGEARMCGARADAEAGASVFIWDRPFNCSVEMTGGWYCQLVGCEERTFETRTATGHEGMDKWSIDEKGNLFVGCTFFQGCNESGILTSITKGNLNGITKGKTTVIIPAGVTTLGKGAFVDMTFGVGTTVTLPAFGTGVAADIRANIMINDAFNSIGNLGGAYQHAAAISGSGAGVYTLKANPAGGIGGWEKAQ